MVGCTMHMHSSIIKYLQLTLIGDFVRVFTCKFDWRLNLIGDGATEFIQLEIELQI